MVAQEQPREPTPTNINVAPRPALRAVPPADAAPGPAYRNSAALAVGKANQVLWFVCGVVELLLAARVFLRLVGASPAASFVSFVYGVTQPLAAPFLGMLPNAAGSTRGAVLEVPTLIGMVVYFLVFLLLTTLLRLLVSRPAAV
jgi:hypothetical protein